VKERKWRSRRKKRKLRKERKRLKKDGGRFVVAELLLLADEQMKST